MPVLDGMILSKSCKSSLARYSNERSYQWVTAISQAMVTLESITSRSRKIDLHESFNSCQYLVTAVVYRPVTKTTKVYVRDTQSQSNRITETRELCVGPSSIKTAFLLLSSEPGPPRSPLFIRCFHHFEHHLHPSMFNTITILHSF